MRKASNNKNNTIRLYKYHKLNDHLIALIKTSNLYLQDGKDFNDPFDVTEINYKKNTEKLKGLHISCFTNSPKNKLMWAHYAESYKGVCMTIDLPKDVVYPVYYSKIRYNNNWKLNTFLEIAKKNNIKKNLSKDFNKLSTKKKLAMIKDNIWNYEKEYRVIIEDKNVAENFYVDKTHIKCKIRTIYIGLNANKKGKQYKELIKVCKQNGIIINEMTLDKIKYKLNFNTAK